VLSTGAWVGPPFHRLPLSRRRTPRTLLAAPATFSVMDRIDCELSGCLSHPAIRLFSSICAVALPAFFGGSTPEDARVSEALPDEENIPGQGHLPGLPPPVRSALTVCCRPLVGVFRLFFPRTPRRDSARYFFPDLLSQRTDLLFSFLFADPPETPPPRVCSFLS